MPSTDYFAILGLPQSCKLDRWELDSRYHKLQAQWHPDRFINESEPERKLAMQQTSLVNDAYRVLKQPLQRAEHLLELKDESADSHPARKLESAFLLEQLELREQMEQLSEARDDAAFSKLKSETTQALQQQWQVFEAEVQQQDWCTARLSLQKLQFLHKLQDELNHLEDRWLDD